MARILANDGIDPAGKALMEKAGHQVDTDKIDQEALVAGLSAYDGILVRSATKVTKEIIDANPQLSLIGRGGVGLDNIDTNYAAEKGIAVYNTPAASSLSVAELAMGHLLGNARFLPDANRKMPQADGDAFKALKKSYSKGGELRGKTMGVVGFGRIGQETAKIAIGLGMKVIAYDIQSFTVDLEIPIQGNPITIPISTTDLDNVLKEADYISIHTPYIDGPVLSTAQFDMMKEGAGLVNCARGGVVDEDAMLAALDSGKLAFAGLDVFIGEPSPRQDVLQHPNISLTPHIGASTVEAQERIGIEIAEKVIKHFTN